MMTAKFEESRKFELGKSELMQSAKRALEKCNFKIAIIDEEKGWIRARTKLSWWSWTEVIDVDIKEDGILNIKSVCYFVAQIFAWGKNKRNVKAFFEKMEKLDYSQAHG